MELPLDLNFASNLKATHMCMRMTQLYLFNASDEQCFIGCCVFEASKFLRPRALSVETPRRTLFLSSRCSARPIALIWSGRRLGLVCSFSSVSRGWVSRCAIATGSAVRGLRFASLSPLCRCLPAVAAAAPAGSKARATAYCCVRTPLIDWHRQSLQPSAPKPQRNPTPARSSEFEPQAQPQQPPSNSQQ